jgi:hypothetical protein
LSWTLNWLLGFHRLGHEVYLVEKSGSWRNGCFDVSAGVMSDDCSFGVAAVQQLLERHDLRDRFCFVNWAGTYHGLPRGQMQELFRSADLFVDISGGVVHPVEETWLSEAAGARLRVCVDGEPGYTQMKMETTAAKGLTLAEYDHYYTVGGNLSTDKSTAPTAGKQWRATFDPVNPDLLRILPPPPDAPFTTVMAWQSHKPVVYGGNTYGQKDVEFAKFIGLPRLTSAAMEIAVAGQNVPRERLRALNWRVRDSHTATSTYDRFVEYIQASRGEFTVCKNVFVATNTGWFSDRSAVYLASGRPVVMQETGFSDWLPCGLGLFAVKTADEAAQAIDVIQCDFDRQSRAAREIACEYLSAPKVVAKILRDVGL